MPILQITQEKLEKIYLPSTEKDPVEENRGWVVMDVSPLLAGDADAVESGTKSGAAATRQMLAKRIKEWNYTQADGTPIDITAENLRFFNMEDFGFLQEKIEKGQEALTDEEKKESSSTSLPNATGAIPITITDNSQ